MADNTTEKWTEIEHLPEWDEEFYDIYTARKHGKWVMLKTLKPALRDNDHYREMIGKEFDVRYNLCHPNIVMINDFEDVPGVGMSIITDDVYGDSLSKLIDKGEVDSHILDQIVSRLPEAISYIQNNHILHHPIRPQTIIFTEKIRNLKLIDVGFDQRDRLTPTAASEDIRSYGLILRQVIEAYRKDSPKEAAKDTSRLARYAKVADRCLSDDPRRRFRDVQDLKLALSGDSNRRIYLTVICFLAAMAIFLGWLCWKAPVL